MMLTVRSLKFKMVMHSSCNLGTIRILIVSEIEVFSKHFFHSMLYAIGSKVD